MWNDGGMDGEAGKGGVGSRHAARQASGETTQEAKKNHNAEQVTAKEAGEEKSEKAKGEKAKETKKAQNLKPEKRASLQRRKHRKTRRPRVMQRSCSRVIRRRERVRSPGCRTGNVTAQHHR